MSNIIKPLKLNTESTFDLSLKEYDRDYQEINYDEYQSYINLNLSKKLLSYENDETPSFDEIYELSKKAYQRFLDKMLINNVNLKTDENVQFIPSNDNQIIFDGKTDKSLISDFLN